MALYKGVTTPKATVTVNYAQGPAATLYSESTLTTTLPNPVTADLGGYYSFYVPDGLYDLVGGLQGGGTISGVYIGTAPKPALSADNITILPNAYKKIGRQGLQFAIENLVGTATNVASYGAVGDGVTDDTPALKAAITACGAYGQLVFNPGRTYRVTSGIRPLSNQTWYGYGAILKRCNQITSATSTNITAGPSSTVISVPDASIWTVGMQVAVFNGALYDTHNHNIIAVNTAANTITVDTAFVQAFPSGGTVVSSFNVIDGVSIPNVKIIGLEVDGNKANNNLLTKWELHTDIYGSGCDYLTVRECYVHDSQCEGIQFGGTSSTIENNTVLNTNGNGIHYSGIGGGVAAFNYVKNCNLAGATAGHVDGCIIFSDNTNDSFILNNYCENGVSGVGSIDTDDNSSVVIQGNIIKNCTVTAIEGVFPTVSGGRVTITGNLIYNSQVVKIQNSGSMSGGVGPYNWIVADNYFETTKLDVRRAYNISVSGNQFKAPSDTTGTGIYFYDVKVGNITNNQVLGYAYGIYIDGSGTSLIESNNVAMNILKNQFTTAIFLNDASGRSVAVDANMIQTDSGYASSTYAGISLKNNTFARNNTMDLQSGKYGIACPNGAASVNGGIAMGNIIRSSGLTASINMAGGSINNLISYNFTQQAIVNGGTNTLTGNVIIF